MEEKGSYTGQQLREMFEVATSWLEKSASEIDALNVFPVPDGDCGTNMLLTMRSIVEEAYRAPDRSAWAVAQAMAHGALMGARGNSGVILSQILRGIARKLEGKESFNGSDFTAALAEGAAMAYQALSRPVEGTILTVAREASAAAQTACTQGNNLPLIMEATVIAARDSVAYTPSLLSVLREAGVVDAGGQGLYVIFDGILRYLKGEVEEMDYRRPQIVPSATPLVSKLPQLIAEEEEPYGYCTEFVIQGRRLNLDKIRKKLENKGVCVLVVSDGHIAHIHIHTFDPGAIVHYATSLGTLHEIKIQNMDDQHKEFVERSKAKEPATSIAIVAVAPGEGLKEVFSSLGVTAVIPGGQTMNPSTRELLEGVESVPQDEVIILPNNKNIIPTTSQVKPLTTKKVAVIPTETIPQGIAALLSFDYDADLETNASAMEEAKHGVQTIEITKATRSALIGGLKVKKRQAIGFLDGELVTTGNNPSATLLSALSNVSMEEKEVVTIYYGGKTRRADAEAVAREIRHQYPQIQLELVYGGQPHYSYIVSLE